MDLSLIEWHVENNIGCFKLFYLNISFFFPQMIHANVQIL